MSLFCYLGIMAFAFLHVRKLRAKYEVFLSQRVDDFTFIRNQVESEKHLFAAVA